VEITADEAREPMGRAKRDHIATVAAGPRVAAAWRERHGSDCSDADIDAMYADFLPLQKQVLSRSSDVIPGVAAAVAELRAMAARIGSSTGYTRELMDVVEPIAAGQGYAPDCTCTADEVAAGRPAPLLNQLAAERLGVSLSPQVVVVDDTLVGIEAGLRSGCTTIGVSRTGNLLGLTLAETNALSDDELQARLAAITATLLEAGAHHVIESVADLPELLRQL
jgi:phosphonoacetaldehyde hydrolase